MASNRAHSLEKSALRGQSKQPDPTIQLLIDRLLHKDVIPPPKIFHKSQNITAHLKAVDRYLDSVHIIHDKTKSCALINTLDDSIQTELFSFPEYEKFEDDYEWIKTTLISMYQKKCSSISPLIYLLNIKQSPDQTVHEYAKQLRVELFQRWPLECNEKKEEYLVRAFLNGLANRNVALAIQATEPTNLDSALQLVKKEIKISWEGDASGNASVNLRQIQEDRVTMKSLQEKITQLENKIRLLEAQLNGNNPRNAFLTGKIYQQNQSFRRPNFRSRENYRFSENVNKNTVEKTCLACGKPGHFSRNCPQRIICFRCGQAGHIARNCSGATHKEKNRFLRQLNDASSTTSESISCDGNVCNDLLPERSEETAACFIIGKPVQIAREKRQNRGQRPSISVSKAENQKAQSWADYVKGSCKKPKENFPVKYAPTLISQSRSEPARNKPVVMGRCFGKRVKLFIDSGAEVNVVNNSFVQELIKDQYPVKFFPMMSKVQCANGSKMAVQGEALLPIEIGGIKATQKFSVVNDLFPKVIIGIRTMKTMGIRIDATSDCIYMGNNVQVPFISRVVPETRVDFESSGPENGVRAYSGAELSPKRDVRLH